MRRRALRAPLFIAAALIALAFSRCGVQDGDPAEPQGPLTARVTQRRRRRHDRRPLADGDEETVRYIGIDTPETVKPGTPVQCGGPRRMR